MTYIRKVIFNLHVCIIKSVNLSLAEEMHKMEAMTRSQYLYFAAVEGGIKLDILLRPLSCSQKPHNRQLLSSKKRKESIHLMLAITWEELFSVLLCGLCIPLWRERWILEK